MCMQIKEMHSCREITSVYEVLVYRVHNQDDLKTETFFFIKVHMNLTIKLSSDHNCLLNLMNLNITIEHAHFGFMKPPLYAGGTKVKSAQFVCALCQ